MKITIVYDNRAHSGLKSGWGFSCLAETTKKLLFDTGDSGKKLIYNLHQLHIAPETIDGVLISHDHWDHTGGLKELLKLNSKAEVFRPTSFSKPTQIYEGIYSTGALGSSIKEQSLVVETQKGNLVITGCAHPGLENIIEISRELGEIYGVVGGFHGFSKLEKLRGIKLIAPCHCTKFSQKIRAKYPHEFRQIKAGSIIEIQKAGDRYMQTGKPIEVTDTSFRHEVLESETPVLVDFWAPWCGPCRMAGPVLEKIAQMYEGRLKVCKVNVDEAPQTAAEYGIMSIPTVNIYKNGEVVDRIIGVTPSYESDLIDKIESQLK